MRKAFDIEDLNLDTLIDTAMEDPKAIAGEIRAWEFGQPPAGCGRRA